MNRSERGLAVVENDRVDYKEIFEQGVKIARNAASLVSDSGTPRFGFRNSLPGLVRFFESNFSREQLAQAPFLYSAAAVRSRFEITGNPNSVDEIDVLRRFLGEQLANEYKGMKPFNQLTASQAKSRLEIVANRLESTLTQS